MSSDETSPQVSPSALFPSYAVTGPQPLEAPTKRAVWRIVLTAIAATVVVIGLAVGGYVLYHDKTSEISELKNQRDNLRATNAHLSGQLTDTRLRLRRANLKLTNTTKGLLLAKKNLTKLRKDLVAADARADANFGAGYSAGNNQGYSSGLVAGSDSLTCSDDPDVTWLPYCY